MSIGRAPRRTFALFAAVGYQWFYNGANFVAFKIGVASIPPLVLSTLRFSIAAAIMLPIVAWRLRRVERPSGRELAAAAWIGIVMLIGGQTLSIWGVRLLQAGVAAVLSSATPLFIALFAWGVLHEPLRKRQLMGIALGAAGIMGMGLSAYDGGGFALAGAAAVLGASVAWAAGSLMATRMQLPADPVVSLTTQLIAATFGLCPITWISGAWEGVDLATVPDSAWAALCFLVVASTLIGYALFLWINRTSSETLANTFFYVAPTIALVLSAIFLDERLDAGKLSAAAVVLVGVAIIVGSASDTRAEADEARPDLRR